MSDRERYPEDPGPAEPVEPSREAVTPRGGFMARPGLKHPPRHAVVVRVGDAPATDDIPLARGSKPPPEPAPSSALAGQDDKVTLPAIPTPRSPRSVTEGEPAPAVIESVPPPSDMPVVASVRPSAPPEPKAARSSRTTIVLAAAAGIVIGLGSVALNRWGGDSAPPDAAGVTLHEAIEPLAPEPPPATLASSPPAPSQRAVPANGGAAPAAATPKSERRTIF